MSRTYGGYYVYWCACERKRKRCRKPTIVVATRAELQELKANPRCVTCEERRFVRATLTVTDDVWTGGSR